MNVTSTIRLRDTADVQIAMNSVHTSSWVSFTDAKGLSNMVSTIPLTSVVDAVSDGNEADLMGQMDAAGREL